MPGVVCVRIVVAFVLAAAAQSAAAEPSGTAIAVVQAAHILGQTGQAVLQPEAPVFSGDRIDTGAVGEAQIRFRDDTKLVVGPNSSLVIDAFVFNPDDTARQISVNAVRGAFRFMTGRSSKDAYSVTTPTATIGVRGTEFDVSVEAEGTTRVANFEGVTVICRRGSNGGVDPGQNCVESTDPCTLSIVRPTQPSVVRYSNEDIEFRNRQLKYYFRYIQDQENLLADFRVDLDRCRLTEFFPPPAGSPTTPQAPPGESPPSPPALLPAEPQMPDFTPPGAPSPSHERQSYDHVRPITP